MGYEIADRGPGQWASTASGRCVCKLDKAINKNVILLKYHLPYWESDDVLNIAYNVLSGGTWLEDTERLRNDETYMNGLGAEGAPDRTTAGDRAKNIMGALNH